MKRILENIIFNIVTNLDCAFSPTINESLHAALVRICTSGDDPLFHSYCDVVVARKMLPTQSSFIKQTEVRGSAPSLPRPSFSSDLADFYKRMHSQG